MFLQTNSVWIRKYRNATVPKLLFNILQEEDPIEWTEPKIKEHMVTKGKFTLGRINYLLKNNFASTSTIKTLILISLATNLTLLIIPPTIP